MRKILKVIDIISLIIWIILGISMILFKNVTIFTIITMWLINFINLCTLFIYDLDRERKQKEETKADD